MHWPEIREAYPERWLVVEALEAHSTPDSRRHPDKIAVEKFSDGSSLVPRCSLFSLCHMQPCSGACRLRPKVGFIHVELARPDHSQRLPGPRPACQE